MGGDSGNGGDDSDGGGSSNGGDANSGGGSSDCNKVIKLITEAIKTC